MSRVTRPRGPSLWAEADIAVIATVMISTILAESKLGFGAGVGRFRLAGSRRVAVLPTMSRVPDDDHWTTPGVQRMDGSASANQG